MRKFLFIAILGLGLAFSTQVALASNINVVINGRSVEFTEETGFPFIDENNRTMVPLRVTLEAAGFTVDFDIERNRAIVITPYIRIEIPINTNFIYVDDMRFQNDTNAVIHNGRTFLPIRAVLEVADFIVEWQPETSSVIANVPSANITPIPTSEYYIWQWDGNSWRRRTIVSYLDERDVINQLTQPVVFAEIDWYDMRDLQRHNIQFSHGTRIDGRFRIDVWSFRGSGIASPEQQFPVLDLTDDFINAQNAEGVFSGIRMRKEDGNFFFNKKDLIENGIIE